MRKNFIFCLFFIVAVLCCFTTYAQKPPVFAFHVSSPTAMFYKIGATVEYRPGTTAGILLNYTQYYKYFPGYQGALEYRIYYHDRSVHENIIYFKAGTGFADYTPSSTPFLTGTDMNKAPGTYYFGGAGVGRHYNYGIFFIEICGGLKYSYVANPPKQYSERFFYLAGPGSIPDIHFNFGLQL